MAKLSEFEPIVCFTCGEELGSTVAPLATGVALRLHHALRATRLLTESFIAGNKSMETTGRRLPALTVVGHDRSVPKTIFEANKR